jgi:hypothetical protein
VLQIAWVVICGNCVVQVVMLECISGTLQITEADVKDEEFVDNPTLTT